MNIKGAAIASSITNALLLIITYLYIRFTKSVQNEAKHCINRDSFIGFKEYLYFAVPSIFMQLLEWWAYEIIGMIAGLMTIQDLGAYISMYNVLCLVW